MGPRITDNTKQKLGRIAFVLDDRLSREKSALLTRVLQPMKSFADLDLLPGSISEDQLLKKLEAVPYQLVLVPWYRYLAWSRVEALYGLTRTSGPTFAGYHCDPVLPYEIGEQAGHLRAILLSFASQQTREPLLLLRALLQDTKRAGVKPLLEPGAPVYCEHWLSGQGLGARMDTILGLNELKAYEWLPRSSAIRICISAFWSLVYEYGPGKIEAVSPSAAASKVPRASFQIGADASSIVLRLCYSLPSSSPKDIVSTFWPDAAKPTAPAQLLLKYSDFLRVHHIAEGHLVEIVAGFQKSAPSEVEHSNIHTLWVEPLAPTLIQELPFDLPGPTAPHLKLLPTVSTPKQPESPSATTSGQDELRAKDRFIAEAQDKIRALRTQISERDTQIQQLRAGGVGTAPPLPPPDAEGLLDAFQERFFEARYQIRQFEIKIAQLETQGGSEQEVETLRRKMNELVQRQTEWIRKIAKTIQTIKSARDSETPKPAP